ncbi:MAG TPA: hypothetical protein VNZ86_12040 [Bacteroidia bacterium]|jgi:hypothetical protein|nr:hypothetical protein [Bacteroidia bacterium]
MNYRLLFAVFLLFLASCGGVDKRIYRHGFYAEKHKGIRIHHTVASCSVEVPNSFHADTAFIPGQETAVAQAIPCYIQVKQIRESMPKPRLIQHPGTWEAVAAGIPETQAGIRVSNSPVQVTALSIPLPKHKKIKPAQRLLGLFLAGAGSAILYWMVWACTVISWTSLAYSSVAMSLVMATFLGLLFLGWGFLLLFSTHPFGNKDEKVPPVHTLLGTLLVMGTMGSLIYVLFYHLPFGPVLIASLSFLALCGSCIGAIMAGTDLKKHPWVKRKLWKGILMVLIGVAGFLISDMYFSLALFCLTSVLFADLIRRGMYLMDPNPGKWKSNYKDKGMTHKI